MRDKADIAMRNCGGKYPKAHWAKKGFTIGTDKVYQCPKTFVGQREYQWISLWDRVNRLYTNLDPNKVSARFIALGHLIDSERARIKDLKDQDMGVRSKLKQKARGAL